MLKMRQLQAREETPTFKSGCEPAPHFYHQKIKSNCGKFYVFHSDNDPYVPLEKGKELAENLGGELVLVKGAGHFNEKAGYTRFKLLLERIERDIKDSC